MQTDDIFNELPSAISYDRGWKIEYYIPVMFRYAKAKDIIVYRLAYARLHKRAQTILPTQYLFYSESGTLEVALQNFKQRFQELCDKHYIVGTRVGTKDVYEWIGDEEPTNTFNNLFDYTVHGYRDDEE